MCFSHIFPFNVPTVVNLEFFLWSKLVIQARDLEDDRFIQSGFIKIIPCWKRISIPHATKQATIYRSTQAICIHWRCCSPYPEAWESLPKQKTTLPTTSINELSLSQFRTLVTMVRESLNIGSEEGCCQPQAEPLCIEGKHLPRARRHGETHGSDMRRCFAEVHPERCTCKASYCLKRLSANVSVVQESEKKIGSTWKC